EIARSFLQKHHLWMKDVLENYERRPGQEHLASDDAIIDPDPSACTDFTLIFQDNTQISTLAFTSKKAAIWTIRRLAQQGALQNGQLNELFRCVETQRQGGEFWKGIIRGRHMRFLLLPSPSGAAGSPTDCQPYKDLLF